MSFIVLCEWLGGADVRLFYRDGLVVERALPGVKSAKRVRVVDEGMGIDPGDGKGEMSARMLRARSGGKRYWFAWESPPRKGTDGPSP